MVCCFAGGGDADHNAGGDCAGAADGDDVDDVYEDWGKLAAARPSCATDVQADGAGGGGGPAAAAAAAAIGSSSASTAGLQGNTSCGVGAEPQPPVNGSHQQSAHSGKKHMGGNNARKTMGQGRMVSRQLLTIQQNYSSIISSAKDTADLTDLSLFDSVPGLADVLRGVVAAIKGRVSMQRVLVSTA